MSLSYIPGPGSLAARCMISSRFVFGELAPNLPPLGAGNLRSYSPGPGICLARCMIHSTSVLGFAVENLPPVFFEPYAETSYAPGPGSFFARRMLTSTSVTMAEVLRRPPVTCECFVTGYSPGPGTWIVAGLSATARDADGGACAQVCKRAPGGGG